MEAYLATYTGYKITDCQLVTISDEHDFAAGSYAPTIPFLVGLNQSILSYADGIDLCQTLGV